MAASQTGLLLIADITGYTAYLNESELEHAQETLSTLLELLIEHTRPPLILSRLAGDAVISYALQGALPGGQTLVEMIEDTYVAFRRAIELMVLNNTCRCSACANVSALDLKFFVHAGRFAIQRLSAQDELVGTDVNLLHRLLKNRVVAATGVHAYTLYTEAAISNLGLEEVSVAMQPHAETVEPIGEVRVWVQDMHAVWQRKRASVQVTLPPDRIVQQLAIETTVPPELVWGYLSQPEYRSIVIGSDRQEILHRKEGRIAPGTVFQCYHGDTIIMQTTLAWEPFERMLTEDLLPLPGVGTLIRVMIEFRLEPTPAGTRLIQIFGKAKGPLHGRLMGDLVMKRFPGRWRTYLENFKMRIERDVAEGGGLPQVIGGLTAGEIEAAAAASLAKY